VALARGAVAQDDAASRRVAGTRGGGGDRLTAELDLLDWKRRVSDLYAEAREIAGSAGSVTRFRRFGRALLPFGTLELYWLEGYGGGVFLPFADGTTGRETYGGGRYLLDTVKGSDLGTDGGRLVLDFNFAYNPSLLVRRPLGLPALAAGESARRRAPGRGKCSAGPRRLILLLRCGHGWHKAVP